MTEHEYYKYAQGKVQNAKETGGNLLQSGVDKYHETKGTVVGLTDNAKSKLSDTYETCKSTVKQVIGKQEGEGQDSQHDG